MSNVRGCVVCGQQDDHPRDILVVGDTVAFFHHDCHAAIDPPCPSCAWLVQHKGKLTGDKWREHVESLHEQLSPEQRELAPWDREPVTSHLNGKVGR